MDPIVGKITPGDVVGVGVTNSCDGVAVGVPLKIVAVADAAIVASAGVDVGVAAAAAGAEPILKRVSRTAVMMELATPDKTDNPN